MRDLTTFLQPATHFLVNYLELLTNLRLDGRPCRSTDDTLTAFSLKTTTPLNEGFFGLFSLVKSLVLNVSKHNVTSQILTALITQHFTTFLTTKPKPMSRNNTSWFFVRTTIPGRIHV